VLLFTAVDVYNSTELAARVAIQQAHEFGACSGEMNVMNLRR
jgi:hypothetical protein